MGQRRALQDITLTSLYANRLGEAWHSLLETRHRSTRRDHAGETDLSLVVGGGLSMINLVGRLGVQYPAQIGLLDVAFEQLKAYLEGMDRYGWPLGLYYGLILGATLRFAAGQYTVARGFLVRGLRDFPRQRLLRLFLGYIEHQLGEGTRADRLVREGLRRIDRSEVIGTYPYAVAILGALYRITRNPRYADAARGIAERGRRECIGNSLWSDVERTGLALVAAADGDPEASARYLLELKSAPPLLRSMVISTDGLRGQLARATGAIPRALFWFRRSLQFCQSGYLPEMAWTWYDYAETLLERGRPYDRARAKAALAQAREITEACGMRLLGGRVDNLARTRW